MAATALTFDKGNHTAFSAIECHNESTQLSYVDGRRPNAKSARMQVHGGDNFGGAPGDRILACRYDTHEKPGMTRWHRFSCKWPTNDGLVWERHTPHPGLDTADATLGIAPLAILRNYNRMVLRLFAGDGKAGQGFPVQMSPGPPGQGRHEEMVLVGSPVATWMDFKLRVKYSEGSDGELDIWVDPTGQNKIAGATKGTPFYSWRGPTCEFSSSLGIRDVPLYACMGLYIDWSTTAAGEVIHDGEFYADTEADVDAPYGGLTPQPSNPMNLKLLSHADGSWWLEWDPVIPPPIGYVLYVDGRRTSNSWDGAKTSWKVTGPGSRPTNTYRLVALGSQVEATV